MIYETSILQSIYSYAVRFPGIFTKTTQNRNIQEPYTLTGIPAQ